jgi:hypothetical protein
MVHTHHRPALRTAVPPTSSTARTSAPTATARATASAPSAAPSSASSAVDSFSRGPSSSLTGSGPRLMGQPTLQEAASATYARHGAVSRDLSSRADVGRLISQSPQVDDMRRVGDDGVRCGGASLLNGMLLDGGYQANADAIRTTAADRGVTLSTDEDSALSAMHDGHLTSRQAAQLQDTMYRIAGQGGDHVGLSMGQIDQTAQALRSHGAFAQSEVTFETHAMPSGSHHATVSVDANPGGPATADSWPGPNGYARVQAGLRSFSDPTLEASTTIHPDGLETRRFRVEPDGQPPLVYQVDQRPVPGAPTATFHDPTTGAPVLPSSEAYGRQILHQLDPEGHPLSPF